MDPAKMSPEPSFQIRPSTTMFTYESYPNENINTAWNKYPDYQLGNAAPMLGNPAACQLGALGMPNNVNNPFQNLTPEQYHHQHQQQQQQQLQGPQHQQQFLSSFSPPVVTGIPGNYGTPCQIPGNFAFGNVESEPLSYPVQFPFPSTSLQNNNRISEMTMQRHMRGKRKTESPPLQKSKQFITEEKMIQYMSELDINSETAAPNESESNKMKRLYMCEEMRKLQNDPILPPRLLEELSPHPCKAVVLWTPRQPFVPPRPLSSYVDENQNNEENDRMQNEDSSGTGTGAGTSTGPDTSRTVDMDEVVDSGSFQISNNDMDFDL